MARIRGRGKPTPTAATSIVDEWRTRSAAPGPPPSGGRPSATRRAISYHSRYHSGDAADRSLTGADSSCAAPDPRRRRSGWQPAPQVLRVQPVPRVRRVHGPLVPTVHRVRTARTVRRGSTRRERRQARPVSLVTTTSTRRRATFTRRPPSQPGRSRATSRVQPEGTARTAPTARTVLRGSTRRERRQARPVSLVTTTSTRRRATLQEDRRLDLDAPGQHQGCDRCSRPRPGRLLDRRSLLRPQPTLQPRPRIGQETGIFDRYVSGREDPARWWRLDRPQREQQRCCREFSAPRELTRGRQRAL